MALSIILCKSTIFLAFSQVEWVFFAFRVVSGHCVCRFAGGGGLVAETGCAFARNAYTIQPTTLFIEEKVAELHRLSSKLTIFAGGKSIYS